MFRHFYPSYALSFWWIYAALLCGSCVALGTAWVMEFGFGIKPCSLCLWQRIPYYAVIILSITYGALMLYSSKMKTPTMKRWLLIVLSFLFILGALLAMYHAGIEWHLWTQTATCSGKEPILDFEHWRQELEHAIVTPCDEAPFRVMGLSPAGWNALLSMSFATLASYGAMQTRPKET